VIWIILRVPPTFTNPFQTVLQKIGLDTIQITKHSVPSETFDVLNAIQTFKAPLSNARALRDRDVLLFVC